MVVGKFINTNQPIVQAILGWHQAIQTPYFLLDTGFTGDLQITPAIAKELGLEITGVTNARLANGTLLVVPTASAIANMEGVTNYVQVIISNSIPLMGISFLEKFQYKATINCKHKEVVLEHVL